MKGSSYRKIKTFIAMGLRIFSIYLKEDVLQLLREMKCPLRIVLFDKSPYDLKNALGPSQKRICTVDTVYLQCWKADKWKEPYCPV